MTESVLGVKSGTITWSIEGKKIGDERFICTQFSYNGKEFINIMAPIYSEYESDIEMINDIMDIEERIVEQTIIALSSYGLTPLVQNVAQKGMKFMYVANPDFREEPVEKLSFSNLCKN